MTINLTMIPKMTRQWVALIAGVVLLMGWMPSSEATDNYAGDFLMLGAGARSLGMGGSTVAVVDDATSAYANPAGLSNLTTHDLTLMHSEQFAGLINYNTLSFGMPGGNGLSIGATLLSSGVGNIKYTRLLDPSLPLDDDNRPVVASREDAADYSLFLAGARRNGKLAYGAAVKIIRRSVGDDTAFGYGIDLGAQYLLDDHWQAGAVIRDATGTSIAWDGKADDRISPTVDAGLAYTGDLPWFGGRYLLTGSLAFWGDTPSSKGFDSMQLGGEYTIREVLTFRAGADHGNGTVGLGLHRLPLFHSTAVDYAYLSDDGLDSTHRVSLSVRF